MSDLLWSQARPARHIQCWVATTLGILLFGSVLFCSAIMPPRVNLRSSAVKRIMQEAGEKGDPDTDGFVASPLESDIFEWHCTLRGVKGTEFEGGLYHLRILLPATYPMSAPDIVLLTPNGRFELDKKICIDGLTSFHAGSWQPAWGVRTAITGLRAFWGQEGEALSAIGALDVPKDERRRLAKLSRAWSCPTCGVCNEELLPDPEPKAETSSEAEAVEPAAEVVENGTVVPGSASGGVAEPLVAETPAAEPVTEVAQAPSPVAPPDAERQHLSAFAAASMALAPSPPTAASAAIPPTPSPPQPAAQNPSAAPPTIPARFTNHPTHLPRRLTPLWLDTVIAGLIGLLLALLLRNGI